MSDLQRQDWLLLLFQGARQPIDRVRIQKALFLFAQRSKAPASEKYSFRPYNYGPFSFQVYPDLERLVSLGLLLAEPDPSLNSPVYSLTSDGEARAEQLCEVTLPKRVALLHEMRDYVVERDFNTLLKDIYRLYPEYATRSVFRS